MINCVIDVIMVPYPYTVICHTCNYSGTPGFVLRDFDVLQCDNRQSLAWKFYNDDTCSLMETTEAFKLLLKQMH